VKNASKRTRTCRGSCEPFFSQQASRAAYVGTGRYSIDAWLLPNFHRLLVQLAQGGWERDDAVLIVAVFIVMRMPLAWALRDVIGPLRCAATAYAVAEVLSRRARTLWTSDATAVAPAFKLLSELVRVSHLGGPDCAGCRRRPLLRRA
jgi:hypothetical protein